MALQPNDIEEQGTGRLFSSILEKFTSQILLSELSSRIEMFSQDLGKLNKSIPVEGVPGGFLEYSMVQSNFSNIYGHVTKNKEKIKKKCNKRRCDKVIEKVIEIENVLDIKCNKTKCEEIVKSIETISKSIPMLQQMIEMLQNSSLLQLVTDLQLENKAQSASIDQNKLALTNKCDDSKCTKTSNSLVKLGE